MKKLGKWSETWWGILWTLALVDAFPGRGVRTFMEMDEALGDLVVSEEQKAFGDPLQDTCAREPSSCAGPTTVPSQA